MDFFFLASKVGWLLLMPSNLLIFLIFASIVLTRFSNTARLGRRVGFASALVLVIVGLLPVGDAMLRPLEQRFPPLGACATEAPGPIAGIILLGGSLSSVTINGSVHEALSGNADRIRLAAALSRTHPQAPLLISGGQAFPRQGARSEAAATADYLRELGVSPDRILLETSSRTTAENAAFAARQSGARDVHWLLVTSAFHMPRAVGTFRAAGLEVIAAPTDWHVDERSEFLAFSVTDRLHKLDTAAKEYLGLLAYWATGQSHELFPGPDGAGACEGQPGDIQMRESQ